MKHPNNDITFTEKREIFHMSGPWMGTLHWRSLLIIDSVMLDSVVTDVDRKRIYFMRCHMPTKHRKDAFFSLCFIKTDTEQTFEVQRKLPSTSLPRITSAHENNDIVHIWFSEKDYAINLNECSLVAISDDSPKQTQR